MSRSRGASFDPETVLLMRMALDDALSRLPFEQRTATMKSELAVRILGKAAAGERDPVRLRTAALLEVKEDQAA